MVTPLRYESLKSKLDFWLLETARYPLNKKVKTPWELSTSYASVSGNLLTGLHLYLQLYEDSNRDHELLRKANTFEEALNTYFELMDHYPTFHDSEFRPEDRMEDMGCFPNLLMEAFEAKDTCLYVSKSRQALAEIEGNESHPKAA